MSKNRGTSNEIEVLIMILLENPGLRARVMEKLRFVKKMKEEQAKRAIKTMQPPKV